MKRQVTLKIASTEYNFLTDADEAHLGRLVELVEERIRALDPKTGRPVSPSQLLVVAVLSLADEVLNLGAQNRKLETEIRQALENTIASIDQHLTRRD